MSFSSLLARLSDMFGSPGIPFANRNYFVDGAFDQWTATSAAANGGYCAPTMWLCYPGAGGAATVAQTEMRPIPLDSNPRWGLNWAQTTASSGTIAARNAPYLVQRIEGVKTLSGKSATLSVKAWVTSGTLTIPAVTASQVFGTGGSPSSPVVIDKNVTWNLTTTPTRFSVRMDFPKIGTPTYGTNANTDNLTVGLWLPPGVTFNLVVAEMQLEMSNPNSSSDLNGNGGAPTVFEYRGIGPEAQRVLRHYYAQSGTHTLTAVSPFSGYGQYFNWSWPVTMRGAPAVTPAWSGGNGVSGEAVNNISTTGCDFTVTTNLGANSNFYVGLSSLVADARL